MHQIGGVIFAVGLGLLVGNLTGLFKTFPFAGGITMLIGGAMMRGMINAANQKQLQLLHLQFAAGQSRNSALLGCECNASRNPREGFFSAEELKALENGRAYCRSADRDTDWLSYFSKPQA